MATYSVYNIKVDNKLSFTPGPTAGYVLAINSNGDTYWAAGGAGGSGTSGSSGSSGSSGVNGANGSSGSSGSSGLSGSSGSSGVNGNNGSSGVNGANGSSGTSGINGATGPAGSGFIFATCSTATGATISIATIPINYGEICILDAYITGKLSGGLVNQSSPYYTGELISSFGRGSSGNVFQYSNTQIIFRDNSAGIRATFVMDANNVIVNVGNNSSDTIDWTINYNVIIK
jgi:hypothetical protein